MGDVVNLRAVRKAKARDAKQAQAAANRALHGRTLPERERDRAEAARLDRSMDGARLDSQD